MKKAVLAILVLSISILVKAQTIDTLSVITHQFKNPTMSDRFAPDSVNFTRNGDTLIIAENKWKGYPSKPIAIRSSQLEDTLLVSLEDTGEVFLAADGRFLTTIKIPNAFENSDNIKLRFEGKVYNIILLITKLSDRYNNLADVKIYPNPAKDELFVLVQEGFEKLVIYNGMGQTVEHISHNSFPVNLQNYDTGIYCLAIFTSKGVIKASFQKK
ncbi:MAG TPA: T9SS type A sorting domain-containing protein [Cytophagaceae bacterium]|jgi:hypothetical protein